MNNKILSLIFFLGINLNCQNELKLGPVEFIKFQNYQIESIEGSCNEEIKALLEQRWSGTENNQKIKIQILIKEETNYLCVKIKIFANNKEIIRTFFYKKDQNFYKYNEHKVKIHAQYSNDFLEIIANEIDKLSQKL